MNQGELDTTACRFCNVAIREGDDLDPTESAHASCVAAEHSEPSDDQHLRLLRQLWKFAKS